MDQEPICANCGISIEWQATIVDGIIYCCMGCAHGGPCECDYDNLPQEEDTKAVMLHPDRRRRNSNAD
jgi:hypothetical protein